MKLSIQKSNEFDRFLFIQTKKKNTYLSYIEKHIEFIELLFSFQTEKVTPVYWNGVLLSYKAIWRCGAMKLWKINSSAI